MVYLGRIDILGLTTEGNPVVAYGVSGRSEASKRRRVEIAGNRVHVGPLDANDSDELRHYDAGILSDDVSVVSNGRQTQDILDACQKYEPSEALAIVLNKWSYEPDEPIYTPRIGGALKLDGNDTIMVLGSISRNGLNVVELRSNEPAILWGMPVYAGDRADPDKIIVPYAPVLLNVPYEGETLERIVDTVYYDVLGKHRVCAFASVFNRKENIWHSATRNLHE